MGVGWSLCWEEAKAKGQKEGQPGGIELTSQMSSPPKGLPLSVLGKTRFSLVQ